MILKTWNGKEYIEGEAHDSACLREIIQILCDEQKGCPWDRVQTHETLKECLVNETSEVLQAIDLQDDENLCEELGDILLQVYLHAQVAEKRGAFTFEEVVQGICDKMIRRHPHLFADAVMPVDEEESLAFWREIKAKEKEMKATKKAQKAMKDMKK